jgi:hypothetical protein
VERLGALVVDLVGYFLEPGARLGLGLEQPGRPFRRRDVDEPTEGRARLFVQADDGERPA